MQRFCPCYSYDACPQQFQTDVDFMFGNKSRSSAFSSSAVFNIPPVQPSQFTNVFQLTFDLRSALTAAAVNLGIVSTKALLRCGCQLCCGCKGSDESWLFRSLSALQMADWKNSWVRTRHATADDDNNNGDNDEESGPWHSMTVPAVDSWA
jgi:hypothetical protein